MSVLLGALVGVCAVLSLVVPVFVVAWRRGRRLRQPIVYVHGVPVYRGEGIGKIGGK